MNKELKVGDKVKGAKKKYRPNIDPYPEANNYEYSGIIVTDYKDGSYVVEEASGNRLLVETYWKETIFKVEE